MTAGLRIARVDLHVADVARSEAYYAQITGLPAGDGALRDHDGRPLITFGDDGVGDGPAPPRAAGLFHTALRFEDRAMLGRVLQRVRDRLTGASDHGVSHALYLRDPDGHGVELYWDLPRERWPKAMYSEPLDLDGLAADAGGAPPRASIGHVHLQTGDLGPSAAFWRGTMGLSQTAAIHEQAMFLSADGYHHHIAVNVWNSRGQPPAPDGVPRLDRIVLEVQEGPRGEHASPEGVVVEVR